MVSYDIRPIAPAEAATLRREFLAAHPVQIRYEIYHLHGWADYYALYVDGRAAGYGAVKGLDRLGDRDTLFEYYVRPAYREHARPLFGELLSATGVAYLESQTNLPLLTELVRAFAQRITERETLFAGGRATHWDLPEVNFRRRLPTDAAFAKSDTGQYVLDLRGEVVASGDLLTHYNPPFADIYMDVAAPYRRRGYGRYLVQELQRVCYAAGRVPAARCARENAASRATLLGAGMREVGRMVVGRPTLALPRKGGETHPGPP